MSANRDRVISLEGNIQTLIDGGFLRVDAEGNCHSIHSWDEHMQLVKMKQEDVAAGAQI